MVVLWMEKESLWKLRKEAGAKEEDEIQGKEEEVTEEDLIDATMVLVMDPVKVVAMVVVMVLVMVMVLVKQVVVALIVAEKVIGLETVQMRVEEIAVSIVEDPVTWRGNAKKREDLGSTLTNGRVLVLDPLEEDHVPNPQVEGLVLVEDPQESQLLHEEETPLVINPRHPKEILVVDHPHREKLLLVVDRLHPEKDLLAENRLPSHQEADHPQGHNCLCLQINFQF